MLQIVYREVPEIMFRTFQNLVGGELGIYKLHKAKHRKKCALDNNGTKIGQGLATE